MGMFQIQTSEQHKALTVRGNGMLSFFQHQQPADKLVFRILDMVRCNFPSIPVEDFQVHYGAYLVPTIILGGAQARNRDVLRREQWEDMKQVRSFSDVPYNKGLTKFGLCPLGITKERGDPAAMYNLFSTGLVNIFHSWQCGHPRVALQ